MKLSDYLWEYLKGRGVEDVFLLPGGGAMHLVNSLGSSGIRYTACLHEQVAGFAAMAYAQARGFGVCLVTSGPGVTNAITPCAAAFQDGTPVLFISGQSASQHVPTVPLVKSITKYAVEVTRAEDFIYALVNAVSICLSGKQGPVWISLPIEVQAAQIEERYPELPTIPPSVPNVRFPDIAQLIREAKRPVILAGHGVVASGKQAEFRKFVEQYQIPVLLTWRGLELLEDENAYNFGRPGGLGQRSANFIIQNSDLLITLGTALRPDDVGHNYKAFAPNARHIVVDLWPNESLPNSIRIPCDAGLFLALMSNHLAEWHFANYAWMDYCCDVTERYQAEPRPPSTEKVSIYALQSCLSHAAQPGDIIVPGSSGPCANTMMQTWRVKPGQRFYYAPALGAMGSGLPMAIGAAIAHPGRRVISVIGDGGFNINIQDLETVKRLNLPIKYFVLSNNGYGSIQAMQRNHFGRFVASNPASGLTLPVIQRIAEAYDLQSYRIYSPERLADIPMLLNGKHPCVIQVDTDPEEEQTPRIKSRLVDEQLVSPSFEDLYPYLPAEQVRAYMPDWEAT